MFEGMAQTSLPRTNTFWTTGLMMRLNETVKTCNAANRGNLEQLSF